MATLADIKQTVYDELVTALVTYTGETESTIRSNKQVRPNNRYEEGPLPAYTFETFETDIDRGLGSGVHVDEITRTDSGLIDTITVRRTKRCQFDIGVHAAGDNDEKSDKLYGQLEEQFTPLIEDVGLTTNTLHSDVETLRLRGTSDVSQPSDAVRGERFRIDVQYYRYIDIIDVPTMETINTDLLVIDEDDNEVKFADI